MPIGDVASAARGTGARYNDGKTPFELVPLHLLEGAARVFGWGKRKYAEWNWAKGMPWLVPYACILRHLAAWFRGEDVDPESGESHISHVICNALMLEHYRAAYPEGDNRPRQWFGRIPERAPSGKHPMMAETFRDAVEVAYARRRVQPHASERAP